MTGSCGAAAVGTGITIAGATVGAGVGGTTGAQSSAMIVLPETVPDVAVTVIVPVPATGAEYVACALPRFVVTWVGVIVPKFVESRTLVPSGT